TYALNFNKEEISSIQIDYAKINFKPEQLKLVTTISKLICEQITIPQLAMRATTWFALSEWQKKKNELISEIATMSVTNKLIATKEIFNIGKERLKEMLSDPKEQSEILLDIVFERAFKYYLDHLNRIQR
ncbi:MAG: hypothetical protein KAW66_03230, partial [Candidatus Lokiarchaeota archaeon]|nr:hypothetical protein [Candidatus Lokiarchaeota archaeon]